MNPNERGHLMRYVFTVVAICGVMLYGIHQFKTSLSRLGELRPDTAEADFDSANAEKPASTSEEPGLVRFELPFISDDALIRIDDNELRLTDLTERLPLPPGTHTLVIEEKGRESYRREFDVTAGKRTIINDPDRAFADRFEIGRTDLTKVSTKADEANSNAYDLERSAPFRITGVDRTLGDSIDNDFFAQLHTLRFLSSLYLRSSHTTPEQFRLIENLPPLATLNVMTSAASSSSLHQMFKTTDLQKLQTLILSRTRVGDSLFNYYSPSLVGLTRLDLQNTHVTEDTLEALGKMEIPGLQILNLSGTDLAGGSIDTFATLDLSSLTILNLGNTGINDASIKSLATANLDNLTELKLAHTSITDVGLAHLVDLDLTSLRILDLSGTDVGDAGLQRLTSGKLPELRNLNLASTNITDESLQRVARMDLSKLRGLTLDRCSVTAKGLRELANLPELAVLEMDGIPVTPDLITALTTIPNLSRLYVRSAELGDADIELLSALSEVRVYLSCDGFSEDGINRLKKVENISLSSSVVAFDIAINDEDVTPYLSAPAGTLTECDLHDSRCSDAIIQRFAESAHREHIVELKLHGSSVTDAVLGSVAQFTSLTELTIDADDLSDRWVDQFNGLPELEVIEIYSNGETTHDLINLESFQKERLYLHNLKIDGQLLKSLMKMTHLSYLRLPRCIISDDDLSALMEALPKCRFSF